MTDAIINITWRFRIDGNLKKTVDDLAPEDMKDKEIISTEIFLTNEQ